MAKIIRLDEDEKRLVEALKARRKEAYSELYDRYSASLYGVVLQVVKSEEMAADVLQESFIKVWRFIDKYDSSKGRFFTWVLNLTRNTAIDHWRSQQRKATPGLTAEAAESIIGSTSENPGHALDADKALAFLGEPERTLMAMNYLQGYSQREIAKQLDMPVGTVKTKMRNALRLLRETFNT
ncbi:MAG: sigma-70 family RNA polymerase sigma factor [Bacteroidota bacterium]